MIYSILELKKDNVRHAWTRNPGRLGRMWEVKARWYLKKREWRMNRKLPREIALNLRRYHEKTNWRDYDLWVKIRLALYLYNANCKVDLEVPISLTWTSLHASFPIIGHVLFHNHTILIWVYIGAPFVGREGGGGRVGRVGMNQTIFETLLSLYTRCVVMVGLPYPNIYSPELKEKMTYLDATLGVRVHL